MFITLSDSDLAAWLLGVSAALGALLAILVSVLVFVRVQAHAAESGILNSPSRTSRDAQELITDGPVAEYFQGDRQGVEDFGVVIRNFLLLESVMAMPSASDFDKETQNFRHSMRARVLQREEMPPNLAAFHVAVLRVMYEIDQVFRIADGIRYTLASTASLGRIVTQGVALLALSLLFALAASIRTSADLADGFNVGTGLLFVAGAVAVATSAFRAVRRILA